jgi:NADPH:quinone reductase-like Zn-dependent oxidoreductase
MRALVCSSLDGPAVGEPPESELHPGGVRIGVRAAAVSPDLLMIRGLYQRRPDLPFAPGVEWPVTSSRLPTTCRASRPATAPPSATAATPSRWSSTSWWLDGRIYPLVSRTYDLDHATDALRRIGGRGAVGKLVILP